MGVIKAAAQSLAVTFVAVLALAAAAVTLGVRVFGLTVGGALALYFVVWWTALFAVLPIGTRPDPEGDQASGGWRGAPERPLLLRKVLATTVISAVLWLGVYALIESDWLSFRSGWLALPER